jgi:hypothetical protein
MSALPVRCAGREEITYPFPGVRKTAYTRPCGWTGQAHGLESALPYMVEDTRIVPEVLVGRLACPDCGGRVELWEAEDQGSGGVW